MNPIQKEDGSPLSIALSTTVETAAATLEPLPVDAAAIRPLDDKPTAIEVQARNVEKALNITGRKLSEADHSDLKRLTAIVKNSLASIGEGSRALREIQNRKLYLETHSTFDAFCREELKMSEQRFSQVKLAVEEHDFLQGKVRPELIPTSERAMRELRKVKNLDQKIHVLEAAAASSSSGRPDQASIERARKEIEVTVEPRARVIKADAALKAGEVFEDFLSDVNLDDLKLKEISALRALLGRIAKDAEKVLEEAA